MILFLLGVCTWVQAQEDRADIRYVQIRQEDSYKRDNWAYWTVSLSGGSNLYFGEYDHKIAECWERICPMGQMAGTRWFSSVWGVRGLLEGGAFRNSAQTVVLHREDNVFYYMSASALAVTNIMNWGRRKRSNRPVSVNLYGGFGVAGTFKIDGYPGEFSPIATLGTELNVRISDYWSLGFDMYTSFLFNDGFNHHRGGFGLEGYVGTSLGLTYCFFSYPMKRKR